MITAWTLVIDTYRLSNRSFFRLYKKREKTMNHAMMSFSFCCHVVFLQPLIEQRKAAVSEQSALACHIWTALSFLLSHRQRALFEEARPRITFIFVELWHCPRPLAEIGHCSALHYDPGHWTLRWYWWPIIRVTRHHFPFQLKTLLWHIYVYGDI